MYMEICIFHSICYPQKDNLIERKGKRGIKDEDINQFFVVVQGEFLISIHSNSHTKTY